MIDYIAEIFMRKRAAFTVNAEQARGIAGLGGVLRYLLLGKLIIKILRCKSRFYSFVSYTFVIQAHKIPSLKAPMRHILLLASTFLDLPHLVADGGYRGYYTPNDATFQGKKKHFYKDSKIEA